MVPIVMFTPYNTLVTFTDHLMPVTLTTYFSFQLLTRLTLLPSAPRKSSKTNLPFQTCRAGVSRNEICETEDITFIFYVFVCLWSTLLYTKTSCQTAPPGGKMK